MLKKQPFLIMLLLMTGLVSVNAHAKVKYPAADFQPKIVYQNDDVQKIAHPPKPMASETPAISQLLVLLILGSLGAYFYKTKYQDTQPQTASPSVKPVTESQPSKVTPVKRKSSDVKRTNKNYKGYKSPRFTE